MIFRYMAHNLSDIAKTLKEVIPLDLVTQPRQATHNVNGVTGEKVLKYVVTL